MFQLNLGVPFKLDFGLSGTVATRLCYFTRKSRGRAPGVTIPSGGGTMPIHLAALVPSSSSIASFLGKQLKDPAMKALGMDPLSKAFRKAIESFLSSLQEEYQRHEGLRTLLQDSVEASVSAFVSTESVQEVL